MTLRTRLRHLFTGRRSDDRYSEGSEADAGVDPKLASSRATGGDHEYLSGDRGSVTGTGDTDEFVGQIAGDDLGYAGETGAERRASAGEATASTASTSTTPAEPTRARHRRDSEAPPS